jgi:excisionase family DNA binding protein
VNDGRAARYLSADAAARYLGVSRRTFFKHVRASVRAVQIGGRVTFDTDDLDAWANAHKTAPVVEQPAPSTEVILPTHSRPGAVRECVRVMQTMQSRESAPPPKTQGLAMARLKELRAQGKIK